MEGLSAQQAAELSLVLQSQGILPEVIDAPQGFTLTVAPEESQSALQVLVAYQQELPWPVRPAGADHGLTLWDWRLGSVASVILTAFYRLTGPLEVPRPSALFERGELNGLFASEPWRTITALTLHADSAHLVSNLAFGIFCFGAVAGRFGNGVGGLMVLSAAALGNLATGIWQGSANSSLGASTALFAAMGLSAGALAAERARLGGVWARPAVPVGVALCFLAYLGVGGASVSTSAHVFGSLAGLVTGGGLGLFVKGRLPSWTQLACGTLSLAMILAAWGMALRTRPSLPY